MTLWECIMKGKMHKGWYLALLPLALLLLAGCGRKAEVHRVEVVPEPVFMLKKEGSFTLHNNPKVSVVGVGQNSVTVKHIMKSMRQAQLHPRLVAISQDNDIELVINDTVNSELGDEGYLLEVRSSGLRLSANTETGLLYAYQTLEQMLPNDVANVAYSSIVLPECTILDYPRFAWRGLNLNLSGNALSVKGLKKVIDVMAHYKLNRLCLEGGDWSADTLMWMVDSTKVFSREEILSLRSYAADMGVKLLTDSLPLVTWSLRAAFDSAGRDRSVVVCPDDYWQFDRYQADPRYQPLASEGVLTLSHVYEFDPLPLGTNSHLEAGIVGAECRLLTDCTSDLKQVEYMLLPRLLAVSECLWSQREKKDWRRFRLKVEEQKEYLTAKGYRYCEGSFTPLFIARRVDNQTMNIAISTEVPNTYIFYTTDRSIPTRESAVYIGPINLARGTHIKILPVYKGTERDSVYEFVIK